MIKALRKDGLLKNSRRGFAKVQYANRHVPFNYNGFFSTLGNIIELPPANMPEPPMEDAGYAYVSALSLVAKRYKPRMMRSGVCSELLLKKSSPQNSTMQRKLGSSRHLYIPRRSSSVAYESLVKKLAVSPIHKAEINKIYKARVEVRPQDIAFELRSMIFKALGDPYLHEQSPEEYEDLKFMLDYCTRTHNFWFLDARVIREISIKGTPLFFEKYLPLKYILKVPAIISPRDANTFLDQWLENPSSTNTSNLEFLRLAKYGEDQGPQRLNFDADIMARVSGLSKDKPEIDQLLLGWALSRAGRSKYSVNEMAHFLLEAMTQLMVGRSASEAEFEESSTSFSRFVFQLTSSQRLALGKYFLDLSINTHSWEEFLGIAGLHAALLCRMSTILESKSSQDLADVLRVLQAHSFNFEFYLGTALPAILEDGLLFRENELLQLSLQRLKASQTSNAVRDQPLEGDTSGLLKTYFGHLNLAEADLELSFASGNPAAFEHRVVSFQYLIVNGRATINRAGRFRTPDSREEEQAKNIATKSQYMRLLNNIKRASREKEPRKDGAPNTRGQRTPRAGQSLSRRFSATTEVKLEFEQPLASEAEKTHLDQLVEKQTENPTKKEAGTTSESIKGLKNFTEVLNYSTSKDSDLIISSFSELLQANPGAELNTIDALMTSMVGNKRSVIVATLVFNELFKPQDSTVPKEFSPRLQGSYLTSSGMVTMDYNKYVVQVDLPYH